MFVHQKNRAQNTLPSEVNASDLPERFALNAATDSIGRSRARCNKMRMGFLGLLLFGCSLASQIAFSEQIQIVDTSGRTQSFVELTENGRAAVRVFVKDVNNLPRAGVQVSLMQVLKPGLAKPIQVATTLDSGIAVFSNVPAGFYTFQVGCESYKVEDLRVVPIKGVNRDSAVIREQELLVLKDENGAEIYAEPQPPGIASEILFSVRQGKTATRGLSARLINEDAIDGRRITEQATIGTNGAVSIKPVFPGSYRVKVDCGVRVGSVAFSGKDIAKLVCSLTSTGLGAAASQGAFVGGSSGLGISTGAIIGGVAVVGGVAVAAGGGGGGGDSAPPTSTPKPQGSPTGVPTAAPTGSATAKPTSVATPAFSPSPTPNGTIFPTPLVTRTPVASPTPTLTIPGLAPTCPPETAAVQASECRPSTAASTVKEEPLSPYK